MCRFPSIPNLIAVLSFSTLAISATPVQAQTSAPNIILPGTTDVGVSGGGNTPTLIVGGGLYPTNTGGSGHPKYDPSSNVIANAIGAKFGYFGAAAKDGVTWAETYLPGTDTGVDSVQLYSLSTNGTYGGFFGSRGSDQSGVNQNVIGAINLVAADNVTSSELYWSSYNAAYVPSGSKYRLIFGNENSVINREADAPIADPYNFNPLRSSNNLRLDCGDGTSSSFSCTSALTIVPNGAEYNNGILFGSNSIKEVGGYADMISAPTNYGLSWFGASNNRNWRVFSNSTGAFLDQLVLGNASLDVYFHAGAFHPFSVSTGGVTVSSVLGSGAHPTSSGSCSIGSLVGGSTIGGFQLTAACSSGTVILTFPVNSPTGWACQVNDLTSAAAVVRQSGYTATTVTFAMSSAAASDKFTFNCAGF